MEAGSIALPRAVRGGGEGGSPRPVPGRTAPTRPGARRPRLLAGASGGGHWVELRRLRAAFEGFDVAYVSTFESYAEVVAGHRYYAVPDASRFSLKGFAPIFARALVVMIRERPAAFITTGSAPMLPFLLMARLFGVRTLWIDSIANAEHLSTSGRIAKRLAHRCLAQWPEVGAQEDIECWGRIV